MTFHHPLKTIMKDDHNLKDQTAFARERRQNKTVSEGLLWSVLRARQLCGLKFRREHSIGPYITDFACLSHHVVVEVDGGCHDLTIESDLQRQAYLKSEGWKVIRFNDKDVEEDTEAVARAIAKEVGLEYRFERRGGRGSGMDSVYAKKPKPK